MCSWKSRDTVCGYNIKSWQYCILFVKIIKTKQINTEAALLISVWNTVATKNENPADHLKLEICLQMYNISAVSPSPLHPPPPLPPPLVYLWQSTILIGGAYINLARPTYRAQSQLVGHLLAVVSSSVSGKLGVDENFSLCWWNNVIFKWWAAFSGTWLCCRL